jgi:hypothetical protein
VALHTLQMDLTVFTDATSFWYQLKTVTKRTSVALWRSPDYVFTRIFVHFFISLFVSLPFLNLGRSTSDLQYRVFSMYVFVFFYFLEACNDTLHLASGLRYCPQFLVLRSYRCFLKIEGCLSERRPVVFTRPKYSHCRSSLVRHPTVLYVLSSTGLSWYVTSLLTGIRLISRG